MQCFDLVRLLVYMLEHGYLSLLEFLMFLRAVVYSIC